jgi:hypothetical protein
MRAMKSSRAAIAAGVGVMIGAWAGAVLAQYPQISDDLRKQAEAAKAEADRRSDEAFARALPEIEAWAKKGKPFIQDASQPSDLPQATILKGRIGLDDPPAGHSTGITIVVRDPDPQTGFLCGRDIFSDMLPGLFGVEVASRLHEQHHPADSRFLYFSIRQKRSVMLAVLDEAEFPGRIGKPIIDRGPSRLFIRRDCWHPGQNHHRRQ